MTAIGIIILAALVATRAAYFFGTQLWHSPKSAPKFSLAIGLEIAAGAAFLVYIGTVAICRHIFNRK